MTAGSVIVYREFIFHDGGSSPQKLLVILNNPQANEKYIVVPTTSRQHKKSRAPGCHSEKNYYFVENGHDKFKTETWILFHDYYELGQTEMLKGITEKRINDLFDIEAGLWNLIKKCILKSHDLPGDYEELIKRN